MKRVSLLASSVVAGLSLAPLVGAQAWAAACVSASVATYTARQVLAAMLMDLPFPTLWSTRR